VAFANNSGREAVEADIGKQCESLGFGHLVDTGQDVFWGKDNFKVMVDVDNNRSAHYLLLIYVYP
jgi:hypothetical protein